MKSFSQKIALITGAASGIGRALAIALAKEGCHLALSDIHEEGLAETKSLLNTEVRCTTHILDVADKEGVYALASDVMQAHGAVDIVINNAGVAIVNGEIRELSYQDFEWVMNINFWGMVYGTNAFLPHLMARDEAWLVNVSSIFGIISFPAQAAYNSSKFAIRGFTEAIRQDLADTSVNISCVHPGGIDTSIVVNARGYSDEEQRKEGAFEFKKVAKTSPAKAAQVIIKGMKRGKKRILIGNDARFLDKIQRLFPSAYTRFIKGFSGISEEVEKRETAAVTH